MPVEIEELQTIPEMIVSFLGRNGGFAFSANELAEQFNLSRSVMRKHLKYLYDTNIIGRKKKPNFNKTFFYYLE